MLFYERVSVRSEWWVWSISRILSTWRNIFNNFFPCCKYISDIFYWHEKITLTQWNFFSCHQGAHVARLVMFSGPKHPTVKGSMFDFQWGLMGRFANRFCACWNKTNYFDLMSHSAICKRYKVASPMQVVQYTLNRYHDINKYKIEYTLRNVSLDAFVSNFKLFSTTM
jgi:hypothetical protein